MREAGLEGASLNMAIGVAAHPNPQEFGPSGRDQQYLPRSATDGRVGYAAGKPVRNKKTPVGRRGFPLFRDSSKEEPRRNKQVESLIKMGGGYPERRHWRLRCRRTRLPFFIRATAGAVNDRLPAPQDVQTTAEGEPSGRPPSLLRPVRQKATRSRVTRRGGSELGSRARSVRVNVLNLSSPSPGYWSVDEAG